ncbi:hypothetical protein D3C76_716260 [compost metagenome]
MDAFRELTENHVSGLSEQDFVCYEVRSNSLLELGAQVMFRGKELYVREVLVTMENGILQHTYTLAHKEGLTFAPVYNMAIIGLSLQGRILDVHRDRVKVHLEIDGKQDAVEAFWFPYSTTYASEDNTGWYCMPEVGDSIRIYFPNQHEERGIAVNSIRREVPPPVSAAGTGSLSATMTAAAPADPMCDPNIPYLKTKYGQIIKFSNDGIEIMSSEGNYIKLSDDGVITVTSKTKIQFSATEEISMEAPVIKVKADELISLECKGNKIEISDSNIQMSGTQVKTN